MASVEIQRTFDYASLDPETRIVVQQKTGEIRERAKRAVNEIIEIGQRLIEVKDRLGHGQFGQWLKSEFDWSDQTAFNYMNVAKRMSQIPNGLDFAPRALYMLAAPSVPEEARQEAIHQASNGQNVTPAVAKTIIEQHRPPAPPSRPPVRTEAPRAVQWDDSPAYEEESQDDGYGREWPEEIPGEPEDDEESEDEEESETELESGPERPVLKAADPAPIPASKPEPPKAPEWDWVVRDLIRVHQSIREAGGIDACAARWNQAKKIEFAYQLAWFGEQLNQWVVTLKGTA